MNHESVLQRIPGRWGAGAHLWKIRVYSEWVMYTDFLSSYSEPKQSNYLHTKSHVEWGSFFHTGSTQSAQKSARYSESALSETLLTLSRHRITVGPFYLNRVSAEWYSHTLSQRRMTNPSNIWRSEKSQSHWGLRILVPIGTGWCWKKWEQIKSPASVPLRDSAHDWFFRAEHTVYSWFDSRKDAWSLPRRTVMGNRFHQAALTNLSFSLGGT
jgi:hypothetical protein